MWQNQAFGQGRTNRNKRRPEPSSGTKQDDSKEQILGLLSESIEYQDYIQKIHQQIKYQELLITSVFTSSSLTRYVHWVKIHQYIEMQQVRSKFKNKRVQCKIPVLYQQLETYREGIDADVYIYQSDDIVLGSDANLFQYYILLLLKKYFDSILQEPTRKFGDVTNPIQSTYRITGRYIWEISRYIIFVTYLICDIFSGRHIFTWYLHFHNTITRTFTEKETT